jgi:hypothetical protein
VTIDQAIIINGILKRHDIAMFVLAAEWHSGCCIELVEGDVALG